MLASPTSLLKHSLDIHRETAVSSSHRMMLSLRVAILGILQAMITLEFNTTPFRLLNLSLTSLILMKSINALLSPRIKLPLSTFGALLMIIQATQKLLSLMIDLTVREHQLKTQITRLISSINFGMLQLAHSGENTFHVNMAHLRARLKTNFSSSQSYLTSITQETSFTLTSTESIGSMGRQ